MTSRFKISSKHDISTLTIHVLICWNKVTLFGQVVPMCPRHSNDAKGDNLARQGRGRQAATQQVAQSWGRASLAAKGSNCNVTNRVMALLLPIMAPERRVRCLDQRASRGALVYGIGPLARVEGGKTCSAAL